MNHEPLSKGKRQKQNENEELNHPLDSVSRSIG